MAPNLQSSFWERMGLDESCQDDCLQAVRDMYHGCEVKEVGAQGYCSFTLRVSRQEEHSLLSAGFPSNALPTSDEYSKDVVVQFRPGQHNLNLSIVQAAKDIYGSFAPRIRKLECKPSPRLQCYEMDMMPGVPFLRYQERTPRLETKNWKKQVNLIHSFASFVAKGWPSTSTNPPRSIRADSPIADTISPLSQCTGKVGANIIPKLEKLAIELPDSAFRHRAARISSRLKELDDYPVVLNHGDLILSNILISPESWTISGVVDWAEAEWLPFGTCLYSLEHLLGYLDTSRPSCPTFVYYEDNEELRELFWRKMWDDADGLKSKMQDVLLMRDLGVLLWYGYAWDEGRIDRVVNEEDEKEEVECLRKFLGVCDRFQ